MGHLWVLPLHPSYYLNCKICKEIVDGGEFYECLYCKVSVCTKCLFNILIEEEILRPVRFKSCTARAA